MSIFLPKQFTIQIWHNQVKWGYHYWAKFFQVFWVSVKNLQAKGLTKKIVYSTETNHKIILTLTTERCPCPLEMSSSSESESSEWRIYEKPSECHHKDRVVRSSWVIETNQKTIFIASLSDGCASLLFDQGVPKNLRLQRHLPIGMPSDDILCCLDCDWLCCS